MNDKEEENRLDKAAPAAKAVGKAVEALKRVEDAAAGKKPQDEGVSREAAKAEAERAKEKAGQVAEARQFIKANPNQDSVVAKAFKPVVDELPADMAIGIKNLVDNEPHSMHVGKHMMNAIIRDIEGFVNVHPDQATQAIRALNVTAAIYAQNPESAREILFAINRLEEKRLVTHEQIMLAAPEAAEKLGEVTRKGGVEEHRARYVAQAFNEMYGNADPTRADAPDLMEAFEQGLVPPPLVKEKEEEEKPEEVIVQLEEGEQAVAEAEPVEDRFTDSLKDLQEQAQLRPESVTVYEKAVERAVTERDTGDVAQNLKQATREVFEQLPTDGSVDILFAHVQAEALRKIAPLQGAKIDQFMEAVRRGQVKDVRRALLDLHESLPKNDLVRPAELALTAHALASRMPEAAKGDAHRFVSETLKSTPNSWELREANRQLVSKLPPDGSANTLMTATQEIARETVNVNRPKHPLSEAGFVKEFGFGGVGAGAPDVLTWPDEADLPDVRLKSGKVVKPTRQFQSLKELVEIRLAKYPDDPREIQELMREMEAFTRRGYLTRPQGEALRDQLKTIRDQAEAVQKAQQAEQRRLEREKRGQAPEREARPQEVTMFIAARNEAYELMEEKVVATGKYVIEDKPLREYVEKVMRGVDTNEVNIAVRQAVSRLEKIAGITDEQRTKLKQSLLTMKELHPVVIDPIVKAREQIDEGIRKTYEVLEKPDAEGKWIIGQDYGLQHERELAFNVIRDARTKKEAMAFIRQIEAKLPSLATPAGADAATTKRYKTRRIAVRNLVDALKLTANNLEMAYDGRGVVDYRFSRVGIKGEHVRLLDKFRDPKRLLLELQQGTLDFSQITDDTMELFNGLYATADSLPDKDWQTSFSPFDQEPVDRQMKRTMADARDWIADMMKPDSDIDPELRKLLRRKKVKIYEQREDGKVIEVEVTLDKGLAHLYEKVVADREVREFLHNARYILVYGGGEYENISKYAAHLRAKTVETALRGEKLTQSMVRMVEMELKKQLSDNNWIHPADLLTNREGLEKVIKECSQKMFTVYDSKGRVVKTLKEWQSNRGYSEAFGLNLLVFGSGFDLLIQADPRRGRGAFGGYDAENILKELSLRHHIFRWFNQAAMKADGTMEFQHHLAAFYFVKMQEAARGEGWDHHYLVDEFQKRAFDTRVGVNQTKDHYGIPLVEVINLFGQGSGFFRSGWRDATELHHLFVPNKGTDILDAAHIMFWNNVDLDATWKQFDRIGSRALFWLAKQLQSAHKDGFLLGRKLFIEAPIDNMVNAVKLPNGKRGWMIEFGTDPKKLNTNIENQIRRIVFDLVVERNPLEFVRLDPTQPKVGETEAYENIRMRVLRNEFGKTKRDADVDRWERSCMMITERLTQLKFWSIDQLRARPDEWNLLRRQIGHEGKKYVGAHFDEAVRYWQALQTEIRSGLAPKNPNYGINDDIQWLDRFMIQELPFGWGSFDLDMEEVMWSKAGDRVFARLHNDNHLIAKETVEHVKNLDELLQKAAVVGKQDPDKGLELLFEFIGQIRLGPLRVHGTNKAAETAYTFGYWIGRYFDKDWQGRFPFGIGTFLGDILPRIGKGTQRQVSLSRVVGSPSSWAWDEQIKRKWANGLVERGYLPRDATYPGALGTRWTGDNLYAEIGATVPHLTVDLMRSYAPYAVILFAFAVSAMLQTEVTQPS